MSGYAAIALSDHLNLAFLCARPSLEKFRAWELFLVDLADLLFWNCGFLDRTLKLLQDFWGGLSRLAPGEDAGDTVTRACNDIPISLANCNTPYRNCRVSDRLYALRSIPYPYSPVFSRTDQLAGWQRCKGVNEAFMAMKLSRKLAL